MEHCKTSGYRIELSYNEIEFTLFNDISGSKGYDIFFEENDNYLLFVSSNDNSIQEIENLWRAVDTYTNNEYQFPLNGVYQIFVWEKISKKLHVQIDYLGLGTIFVNVKNENAIFYSSIGIASLENNLSLDESAIIGHFGFGYHVLPHKFIYKDIYSLKGNTKYEYISNKLVSKYSYSKIEITQNNEYEENAIIESIDKGINGSFYENNLFFGFTSGKDSLALISSAKKQGIPLVGGTFGDLESGDVIQGKMIADSLKANYYIANNCCSEDFIKYANLISFYSGGLCTLSYVDMLNFADTLINEKYGFVMGEGGGCIRDFFNFNDNIRTALNNYITPERELKSVLSDEFISSYWPNDYFDHLMTPVLSEYNTNDTPTFLMNFYRYGRMPGNFSLRRQILSPRVSVISPFLHRDFIKNGYSVPLNRYLGSNLHKRLIEVNDITLLPYFTEPKKGYHTVQNWDNRFSNNIISNEFIDMCNFENHIFDIKKVRNILTMQRVNFDRGGYLLLRILSFLYFKNAVSPSFKTTKIKY